LRPNIKGELQARLFVALPYGAIFSVEYRVHLRAVAGSTGSRTKARALIENGISGAIPTGIGDDIYGEIAFSLPSLAAGAKIGRRRPTGET
jgi:hypothetical protein